MIQNCKLKLVFKSKKSQELFQSIHSHRKSDLSPSKASPIKHIRTKQQYETLGIKRKIINELQTPIQNFKNPVILNNVCTPLEAYTQSEFEYCYTFQSSAKHTQQQQPLLCRGKKVQRSLSPAKSKIGSRQFSSKQLTNRPTSTSEYLSHRKTGFVPVQPFEKSKIFTMNPFDYQRIYMKKLKVSLDFYYKVQFANRVSIPLTLSRQVAQKRYKVYVGKGNNHFLVQETLRKRFWYDIVNEPKDCDLFWTQPHQNQIHNNQPPLKRNRRPKFVFSPQYDSIPIEQRYNSNQNCSKQNSLLLSSQDCEIIQELMKDKGYDFIYPEIFHPIITNHIPNSEILNQPKSILKLLQDHFEKSKGCDPWHIYPKTYHINNPTRADMHFYTFTVLQNKKKLWIIKPGEKNNNENITEIIPASKIMQYLRKTLKDGDGIWTFLLQEYIERPFLYKGRKFDLHHFILITIIGGGIRVYWYYQGYVRLSSQVYTLKKLDPFIHFTSNTIQQKNPNYSAHELGNKLSYNDFQRYLSTCDQDNPISFNENVIPKMKQITLQLIYSCYKQLDPSRKGCNFELIGLDFLMTREGKVMLTGVNTNPSLNWDNPVIGKIVPSVVDQALELAVDPLLPPTSHFPAGERLKLGADPLYSLKFQCIFDQFNMKP